MDTRKAHWQAQIVAQDDLLDEEGNLKHRGYAKELFLKYDRRRIGAPKNRIKEWDYYLIYNESYALALTVADNGYMGMLSASVIDFKIPDERTKSVITWFPMGKFNMPTTSKTGNVKVSNKKVGASFVINEDGTRELNFAFKKFKDGKDLKAQIILTDEPKDSMVIVTPFDKPKHFYYNQKIVGFYAQGSVKLGGEEIISFNKANTRAILDWGRGVWTYKNTWFWGSACGEVNGHEIGFNIGYGFGDTSAGTENMVFYDGKAHKLEHINIVISSLNKKDENYMKPWRVTSSDGRFEMTFTPIIDRFSNTDIGIIGSNQHQVFGKFSGQMKLDDETIIEVKDLTGFIEKVVNKW